MAAPERVRRQSAPARAPATAPVKAFPGVESHLDEAAATALTRDAYNRERYVFQLRIIYVLLGILVLSILVNMWLALRPQEIRYFATDSLGQIRELTTLDRPIQSKTEVVNWVGNALTEAFTFSFATYQEQFGVSRLNFTEAGWAGFQLALQNRKIIDDIIANKYVASAAIRSAPVVTQEGITDNGRWGWKIEVPIIVAYESASAHLTQEFIAEVVVVRRPEVENPRGLGIAQIIAK